MIAVLGGFTLFHNLGDRLLWGDEAETALLAVNITKFGVPKVLDGKNRITLYGLGRDSNQDDLWIWTPWLDEYIASFSFRIFGKSTFAARLPFAAIGFCTILCLLAIAYRIYGNHEVSFIAGLLCVTNVVFLLHARQCRYYSVTMLAQIGLFYGYYCMLEARLMRGVFLVIASLTAQFYSNYVVVFGNLAGLTVTSLALSKRHRSLFWLVPVSLGGFGLLALPWILYAKPLHRSGYIGFSRFFANLEDYVSIVHFFFVPLVILLVPICIFLTKVATGKDRGGTLTKSKAEILVWFSLLISMVLLSLLPHHFMRYLLPMLPVVLLLAAVILTYSVRHKLVRYVLVLLLCSSNAVSVVTAYPVSRSVSFKMPFVEFAREITSSYEDRLKDVVHFLRENGQPTESVLVKDPEFPLVFYTDMRIIDLRLAKREDLRELPDWVLSTSPSGCSKIPPIRPPRGLLSHYESIHLRVHDSRRCGSRPDPRVREPLTSPRLTGMVIFRRLQ